MKVAFNPEMLVLAREYRNLTQHDLARSLFVSQAKVAKLEGGLIAEVPEEMVDRIASKLEFPKRFFYQEGSRIGFGSSALFYRRRSEISAADRKRISGVVNIIRLGLRPLLSAVDVEHSRHLPLFSISEFEGTPADIARAVRAAWGLPSGPIENLTALVESAGVMVVPCDFGCRAMDATSLKLNDLPPLVFMNRELPGDRWRFTLAHELGHLVMHEVPRESMEDEADAFAAELLMPASELTQQFKRLRPLRLQDLADLKPYWRTSMGSLLVQASKLDFLTDRQKQYLWRQMSMLGYRQKEPIEIPREQARSFEGLVTYFLSELEHSVDELATSVNLLPREFRSIFSGARLKPERHLRAVN
jgi:Zn-dependent peptidase ImmA (M78 family)/transcriptional regulator with XRE-family HTH domain